MQVKLFPQPPAGRAGVAPEELHLENNLFSTFARWLLIAIPEDSALTTLLALDVPPRSPCEPGGSELLSVFPYLVGSWGPQASPARCPLGWLTAAYQAAQGWSAVVKEPWLDIYPLTSLWGPTWGDGAWGCRCPFSANRRKGTVGIHLFRSTVQVIRALRSLPLECGVLTPQLERPRAPKKVTKHCVILKWPTYHKIRQQPLMWAFWLGDAHTHTIILFSFRTIKR